MALSAKWRVRATCYGMHDLIEIRAMIDYTDLAVQIGSLPGAEVASPPINTFEFLQYDDPVLPNQASTVVAGDQHIVELKKWSDTTALPPGNRRLDMLTYLIDISGTPGTVQVWRPSITKIRLRGTGSGLTLDTNKRLVTQGTIDEFTVTWASAPDAPLMLRP